MSQGWSVYVIALVVLNIAGSAWLLWWTARRRPGDGSPEAATTGHVWDGDLSEYNKPLPRWWINLFWLTILFAIAYLAWYPGLGAFAGTGGWTSHQQHAAEQAAADQRLAAKFAGIGAQAIDVLARNPDAVATGQRIFANNCATCHGSDARGAKGFPNLADRIWHWGGSPAQILASIQDGRQAAMPAFASVLGSPANVTATAVYVQSLSGQKVDALLAAQGQQHFAGICSACHGADGKGNAALGAPDLSDGYWLYGRGIDDIRSTINHGRAGQMPAHLGLLGDLRTRLAGAYVYSLSQAPAK